MIVAPSASAGACSVSTVGVALPISIDSTGCLADACLARQLVRRHPPLTAQHGDVVLHDDVRTGRGGHRRRTTATVAANGARRGRRRAAAGHAAPRWPAPSRSSRPRRGRPRARRPDSARATPRGRDETVDVEDVVALISVRSSRHPDPHRLRSRPRTRTWSRLVQSSRPDRAAESSAEPGEGLTDKARTALERTCSGRGDDGHCGSSRTCSDSRLPLAPPDLARTVLAATEGSGAWDEPLRRTGDAQPRPRRSPPR